MLERLRRGTPEARAEFFRLYAPRAREILFLQGMCDDVDDGVQEVFVKVFRATLPPEETFLGWFYRVILNTGRDLGRRRRSRLRLLRRLTDAAPADVVAAPALPTGDPHLRDALQALGPSFARSSPCLLRRPLPRRDRALSGRAHRHRSRGCTPPWPVCGSP